MANHLTRIAIGLVLLAIPSLAYAQGTGVPPPVAPAASAVITPIDPTKNVLDLVSAAILRQDDLRKAEAVRQDALREASDKFNAFSIASIKTLFDVEVKNTKEIVALRAEADERLRIAESKRIDAIRLVDVNAVAVASQKADQQATTLAAQVSSVAEALRKSQADSADRLAALVQTTATTAAAAQQQQFANVTTQVTGLSTRITTLEQAQSEGKGKALAADPGYQAMLAEVKALRDAAQAGAGKSEGISGTLAALMSIGGLLVVILGIGVSIMLRRAPVGTRRR